MGNRIKTGAEKIGNSFGDFIISVFNVFSKILGVLLIITGLFILSTLFIGIFTLGTSSFIDAPWQEFIEAGNFTDYPVWTFGLLMFFAVGIPFFFLTVLGFKLQIYFTSYLDSICWTCFSNWNKTSQCICRRRQSGSKGNNLFKTN
jgi:hypothetical protein